MKLAQLLSSFLLSCYAFADEDEVTTIIDPLEETQNSGDSELGQLGYVNFDVSYDILERPGVQFTSPIEFASEETATFNITFRNNEASNITIVGIAGNVIDTMAGHEVANVTTQELGPFEVPVNESVNFRTAIQLTLPEGSFYLAPLLFVVREDELMKVGIKPVSIFVSPPAMSFFNPSFLSIQLLFAAVVIGAGYFFLESKNFGGKSGGKGARKGKKNTDIRAATTDEWLPDMHKK